MFRCLEELKRSTTIGGRRRLQCLVEEYCIKQCDLEQVFMKLVKKGPRSKSKKRGSGSDNVAFADDSIPFPGSGSVDRE